MATLRHKRIQLLQGFTPRLTDPSGEALIITPTAATININENALAQLVALNTVKLEAICLRGGAVINWTTSQGTLSSPTGTSVTLTYSTVPVTDMSSITVTATTSVDSKYSPTTLTKTATITKVAPAQTSIELTLYQRAASAPGVLPSAATYNTSTKAIGGTLNSWQTTIPIGTDPVYITKASVPFYNALTNIARPVSGWLVSAKLAENGTSGTSGDSVDIVYKRSLSIPTTPTTGPGVPLGWESNVSNVPSTPTGGSIWASTGTKIGGSTNYTWELPVVITGSNIAELTIFIRAVSTPATPSGGAYNFATKAITPPALWSADFPIGTNPVYTARITASSGDANATVTLGTWSGPVLSVQNGVDGTNGTNGSDATVTLANMAAAIDAVNGNYVKLNDLSTAYVTGTANGTGVYIGAGGIYGKNGSSPTFAISATTGDSIYYGKLDVNKEVKFYGNITAGTIPVTAWAETTALSDCGFYGTIAKLGLTSGGTVYLSGIQGRVLSGAYGYTAGVAGTNYSLNSTSYAGYFEASGSGGSALFVYGGGVYINSTLGSFDIVLLQFKTNIGEPLKVSGLTSTALGARFLGSAPMLILDRTSLLPWYIKHEATNLVISYNNTSNDLILNSSGDLTARGNVTAYSDKAIKTNILPITLAIAKLKQINGYRYKNLLANKLDCGIIAQEIEKILPELVQVGSTEFEGTKLKTVNYNGVVALLVAANRELIARIEALEKQVHATSVVGNNKLS